MRHLLLIAAAALAVAGCKNNDQHDNTMNVDENLSAENIVSNDVTAIDAVTGDAANMAADVNYEDETDNSVANLPANEAAPKSKPPATEKKASSPASNSTAAVSANGAE